MLPRLRTAAATLFGRLLIFGFKVVLGVLIAVWGSYGFLEAVAAWRQLPEAEETTSVILIEIEDQDFCRIDQPEECPSRAAVLQPQAVPLPAEQGLKEQIAALAKDEVSFAVEPQKDAIIRQIKKCDYSSEEALEQSYEEALPEEIIDDEEDHSGEAGYFVYTRHKNIKDMAVNIDHKPPYFGEIPVIAVVIDDMGINRRRTKDISSINAPLTASFLTYAGALEQQVSAAAANNQEIMIHVPMEAKSNANAAPDVLTTAMTQEDIRRRFEEMLAKIPHVKGINNHMGSKFTEDAARMETIMEVLKEHDLFFLDSKTSAKSQGKNAALKHQVAYANRHVFLDNENDRAYIDRQLALTVKLARKNGYAIAIGHPKSQTYEALKDWTAKLDPKEVRLVHLSEIVKVLNPGYLQEKPLQQEREE